MTTTPTTIDKVAAAQAVIDRVAVGGMLKHAAAAEGISLTHFHTLISRERDLAVSYARAKELRADLLADEGLQIVDDNTIDANRARNQFQYRQWLASKLNPKTFGERIDLNVSQAISISDALTSARARLRPACDLDDVSDVDVIENTGTSSPAVSDTESATPGLTLQVAAPQTVAPPSEPANPPAEPDIFA